MPNFIYATTLIEIIKNRKENTKDSILLSRRSKVVERNVESTEKISSRHVSKKNKRRIKESTDIITSYRYYVYKPDIQRIVNIPLVVDPIIADVANVVTKEVNKGSVIDISAAIVVSHNLLNSAMASVSIKAPVDIAEALESYYGKGDFLIWVSLEGIINQKAFEAIDFLSKVNNIGLEPADYFVKVPDLKNIDAKERAHALMRFELLLSAKVLAYVQDNQRGRVDPNRISGYYDFTRKKVDISSFLKLASSTHDISKYLVSFTPSNTHFNILQAELEHLLKLQKFKKDYESSILALDGSVIKPGMSSSQLPHVIQAVELQLSKNVRDQYANFFSHYKENFVYDGDAINIIKSFQKDNELRPDGIINHTIIKAIISDKKLKEKISKLIVSLEQERWLPADLGSRYVFINQPAFMAYYIDNRQEKLSMPVVVGSKNHQTNFFNSQIQIIELNPYWGVPQSIIINEMLPRLRSDPSYLDRMGYQVELKGKRISSSSVNWYGSTSNIAVRQPPSAFNALGELKILFPNRHAIYMHATPQVNLFKRSMRALSHGCIRLSDPRAMAAAILGYKIEDLNNEIKASKGKNKVLSVSEKIPVYISYFTAWPNKQGVIEYFQDIYERDDYVNKAFDKITKSRIDI
ncbi:L,D-transpeptidase family protein [Liberibacter crescens]|nr:L,D-transpeptidase family protein [Liberibacter crescens]